MMPLPDRPAFLLELGHWVFRFDNHFTCIKRNIDNLHDHPRLEFTRYGLTLPVKIELKEIHAHPAEAGPMLEGLQ